MDISIRNVNDFAIVDIHTEELDKVKSKTLKNILNELIKTDKINILINLSNVASIDSLALGCLIIANRQCQKNGGGISMFGIQPDVLMILYIIQLDKYLNIYNNEIDALNNNNMLVKRRFKVVN